MKHGLVASQTRRALDALHESVREPLPRAQVARFAALLHRTIGLDAASIGDNAIERAVADRYAAWRASNAATSANALNIDDFWVAVNGVPQQLQALIEAVVVPETWFFRDSEAFNALVTLARTRLADQPIKPVRILSMPCSTGEEAYTIAMAMLDAGIAPERFSIDAIDISNHALDIARQARYGSNAFRSRALGFRDRHFKPSGDHWRLSPDVAERVRFRQANLLTLETQAFEPYDFVFCRNVLIYFDREMQRTAVRVLDDLLAPGATLFVGPAETGLMMREGMTSAKLALAFAFRRPEHGRTSIDDARLKDVKTQALYSAIAKAEEDMGIAARQVASRGASASASLAAANAFASRAGSLLGGYQTNAGRPASVPAARSDPQAPASPAPGHQGTLLQAHSLANSGSLPEAAAAARAYLAANPSSADAYYLLGVIADAQGAQTEARGHYKRALYLDPEHGEALTHLAAVLGLEGDRTGAQLLLARAARAGRVSGGRDE
ncbi:CheR family methyltransferase [Caballeronia sp. dw_276]|jgi:chemotaxis protein methyltransferase WspC|uniref:CheR family methyltransferase n=1 Tax=Caballeronia sp. dw_276 TaxID=2719795 RepID=UPI001BD6B141|nr:CheR family methyltransferase [Caballeronia sp. dw_276]